MNLFDAISGQLNLADFAFVGRLDEPNDSEVDMLGEIQLLIQAVEQARILEPRLLYDPSFHVLFEDDLKDQDYN